MEPSKKLLYTSNTAIIAIFLALIRCIAEPFRLQHYSDVTLCLDIIKPFLLGALSAAIGLLVMSLFHYFKKHLAVIIVAALVVVLLLIIKSNYSIL